MSVRPATLSVALFTLMGVAGCSHMPHWFRHKDPPPPQVVHELVITTAAGADLDLPQYWQGNTLIVDLRLVTGQGQAILKPREHTFWPVRIAFRVLPNEFGALEVSAAQRVVLPITTSGSKPVDLQLDPGVFIMKSPQMAITWGPADQSSGT